MMNNQQQAAVNQFHIKHGGDYGSILHNGMLYYEDGSAMEASRDGGAMIPPPSDPRRLIERQLFFWSKKREKSNEEFLTWKQQLLWQCNGAMKSPGPNAPRSSEIEKLELLCAEVQKCDRKLKELRDLQEALKPDRERAAEEAAARTRAKAEEARAKIDTIRV